MNLFNSCNNEDSSTTTIKPSEMSTAILGTWKNIKNYGKENGESWSESWSDNNAIFYTFEEDGKGHYTEKEYTANYTWVLEDHLLNLEKQYGTRNCKIHKMTRSQMICYFEDSDGYLYEELIRVIK